MDLANFQLWDEATSSFRVPRVNGQVVLIPMKKINWTLSRQMEVATVNVHKAPELLATMNVAWLDLKSNINTLEMVLCEVQREADRRKSIVILDEVPKILAAKGLASPRSPSGSADQRDAILALDPEYDQLKNHVAMIEAVQEELEDKLEAVTRTYESVKKILGAEQRGLPGGITYNRGLGAASSLPEEAQAGQVLPEATYPAETAGEITVPEPSKTSNIRSLFGGAK